jgi:hypothetical protein
VLLNGFAGPEERDARGGTPNKANTDGPNEHRDGAFTNEQSPTQYTKPPTPVMARCYSQMVYGHRKKSRHHWCGGGGARMEEEKRPRGMGQSRWIGLSTKVYGVA